MNTAVKNSYQKPKTNFKANKNNKFKGSMNKATAQLSQQAWHLQCSIFRFCIPSLSNL